MSYYALVVSELLLVNAVSKHAAVISFLPGYVGKSDWLVDRYGFAHHFGVRIPLVECCVVDAPDWSISCRVIN